MLFTLLCVIFYAFFGSSRAFVKSHLDEPTVRKLMLTSNVRKSSMEIANLGGFTTQQLTKNYIIVHLLENTRWKDTNVTRLATDKNFLNATEYAEAKSIFDMVNRPYEEDSASIDSVETADDDCPDGDCALNDDDYTLKFEEEDEEKEMEVTTVRPSPKFSASITKRPIENKNAATAGGGSVTSTSSSWVLEWHLKEEPTAKVTVSNSCSRSHLRVLAIAAEVLMTLILVVSL